MNAKSSDFARVQEIWDVAQQTKRQIEELGFTKDRFLAPSNNIDDLISEGIMNRVFRITEEAGAISAETERRYGFETRGASGVRNRLAHAYGEVDRGIVWQVIESDLDELLESCRRFAEDAGVEL